MLKFRPFEDDAIYSPKEVSDETPFSEKSLAQWRWKGCGPEHMKLHGRVFYRGSALNAWLASGERDGAEAA